MKSPKFKIGDRCKYIGNTDGYTIEILAIENDNYIINIEVINIDNPRRYLYKSVEDNFRLLTPLEQLL